MCVKEEEQGRRKGRKIVREGKVCTYKEPVSWVEKEREVTKRRKFSEEYYNERFVTENNRLLSL